MKQRLVWLISMTGWHRSATLRAWKKDLLLHEGAVGVDAGALGLSAEGLVTGDAVVALVARVGDPLDADAVADLELGDGVVDGDNDTSTLVASNAGAVGLEGPLVLDDVKVSLNVSVTSTQREARPAASRAEAG